jgi:ATP-binding cassette subfamily B (MDR/TAP) protein 1
MLLTYAGGFYAGAKLIEHKITNINSGEIYTLSNIITVFFTLLTSFQCIGMINSPMNAITKGRVSAATIFAILDQKPGIKQKDPKKITPESLKGDIEFRNVKFNYPSRPKVKVLDGINLKIPQGKKIALVGHTGCGKSTIIQLIERFYDPDQGQVLIDGINLSEYNLHGFRKFVGYVGQEPV